LPFSAARSTRYIADMGSDMASGLTHLGGDGRARMVDVGAKPESDRVAIAEGALRMADATLSALQEGRTPKGDPLLVAQVAGIQAAKRTAELIPLCHPLPLTQIDVELEADDGLPGVRGRAVVRTRGRTGVEMEALMAVSVALLTAYDMLKAIDRTMNIEDIRVVAKEGGRSGSWAAGEPRRQRETDG
jgi:cyclic pyranopterin monophosphate synthase